MAVQERPSLDQDRVSLPAGRRTLITCHCSTKGVVQMPDMVGIQVGIVGCVGVAGFPTTEPCPGARSLVDIKPAGSWPESVWTAKTTKEDESRERQPAHHREGPLSRFSPAEYSRQPSTLASRVLSALFVTFVVQSPRDTAPACPSKAGSLLPSLSLRPGGSAGLCPQVRRQGFWQ
jgi:hypothetical protein